MEYATENKDFQMARTAAQFVQYRYHRSEYKKEMYNSRVLMDYYKSIKDTSTFLRYVVETYDDYLLVTPDSSQRYEAKILDRMRSKKSKDENGDNETVARAPKDYFAALLNYGAGQVLNSKTKDPNYLSKGISYCQHALLLAPSHYRSKVALAQLLYRSGFFYEAEKTQREAINTFGIPPSTKLLYSADLEKIINRTVE